MKSIVGKLPSDFDHGQHVGEDVGAGAEQDRPAVLGGSLVERRGDRLGGKESLPQRVEEQADGAAVAAPGQLVEALRAPPRIDRSRGREFAGRR